MTTLAAPPEKPETRPEPDKPNKPAPASTPTSQDIKAIQDGLGRFMPLPWHEYDEITALPPNGPEILEQALQEVQALPPWERPDLESARQEAAACLESLRWTLDHIRRNPEKSYPLTWAQAHLYQESWRRLEKIRKELAETLGEALAPFIGVISDPALQSSDLKKEKGLPCPLNPAAAEESRPC